MHFGMITCPEHLRRRDAAGCSVPAVAVVMRRARCLCIAGAACAAAAVEAPTGTWPIASGTLRAAVSIASDGTCYVSTIAMYVCVCVLVGGLVGGWVVWVCGGEVCCGLCAGMLPVDGQ